MKILLVWPKARTDPDWGGDLGAIAEPLALEYLAAAVIPEGHEVKILDLRLHPGSLDAELIRFRPDIVGVTAFSMHVRAGLDVMKRAKELFPGVVTIAGGHHATILPEDFFEPQVDLVVCGEGTRPFRQIVGHLARKEQLPQLKGVWQNKSGSFEFGGDQDPFDINSLPLPDRKITAADRSSYFIDWMTPIALVRTSVGCPFRCTFCSLWKVMDGRYFKRSIAGIVEEIQSIEEEFVFLVDDEAFIDGPRMIQLAEALKEAGVKKKFFAYCRVDSMIREKEALRKWTEVGLERLFVGIDAISEKDLTEYNKKYKAFRTEDALEAAAELGIEILAQFVINTDYTLDDFKYLVRFIKRHKIGYPTFTVLTPLPGTSLLDTFDKVVLRQPNGRPDWNFFDTQSSVVQTKLPADVFRYEYRNLFKIFKNSYSKFLVHRPNTDAKAAAGKSAISYNDY